MVNSWIFLLIEKRQFKYPIFIEFSTVSQFPAPFYFITVSLPCFVWLLTWFREFNEHCIICFIWMPALWCVYFRLQNNVTSYLRASDISVRGSFWFMSSILIRGQSCSCIVRFYIRNIESSMLACWHVYSGISLVVWSGSKFMCSF